MKAGQDSSIALRSRVSHAHVSARHDRLIWLSRLQSRFSVTSEQLATRCAVVGSSQARMVCSTRRSCYSTPHAPAIQYCAASSAVPVRGLETLLTPFLLLLLSRDHSRSFLSLHVLLRPPPRINTISYLTSSSTKIAPFSWPLLAQRMISCQGPGRYFVLRDA